MRKQVDAASEFPKLRCEVSVVVPSMFERCRKTSWNHKTKCIVDNRNVPSKSHSNSSAYTLADVRLLARTLRNRTLL